VAFDEVAKELKPMEKAGQLIGVDLDLPVG
jgi:hypothetical protein